MRVRPRRAAGLVLLLAAIVFAFVYRSSISAQARALVVLTVVSDPPVGGWLTRVVTNDPGASSWRSRASRRPSFGPASGRSRRSCSSTASPPADDITPTYAPGERSRTRRLRGGRPDPRGLARGELTERTLEDTAAVACAATERPDATGTVALVGVSAGAALALLVAQGRGARATCERRGGDRAVRVAAEAARIATTGTYGERRVSWRAKPFLGLVVARSLVAGLPRAPTASGCGVRYSRYPTTRRPLEPVPPASGRSRGGREGARRAAREPRSAAFDALYAALPVRYRRGLDASPHSTGRIASGRRSSSPRHRGTTTSRSRTPGRSSRGRRPAG